jgi:hypothetical protein
MCSRLQPVDLLSAGRNKRSAILVTGLAGVPRDAPRRRSQSEHHFSNYVRRRRPANRRDPFLTPLTISNGHGMPRKRQPPRLWERSADKSRSAMWVILDHDVDIEFEVSGFSGLTANGMAVVTSSQWLVLDEELM